MLGTSLNDAKNRSTAAVLIANKIAQGQEVTKDSIGYTITDGKYVWIPYGRVTQDNYKDFM